MLYHMRERERDLLKALPGYTTKRGRVQRIRVAREHVGQSLDRIVTAIRASVCTCIFAIWSTRAENTTNYYFTV